MALPASLNRILLCKLSYGLSGTNVCATSGQSQSLKRGFTSMLNWLTCKGLPKFANLPG